MKSFYSIITCAAVSLAVSVSAQTATTLTTPKQAIEPGRVATTSKFQKSIKSDKLVQPATTGRRLVKKSPAAAKIAPKKVAASVADICGEYEISYTVELQGANDYAGEMTVTEGTEAGTVVFNIPFENSGYILEWNVVGTVDTETGIINISKDQPTGFQEANFALRHWDWDAGAWADIDEINVEYTGDAIVFDEDDALGLQATSGGWYTLFDMIIMTKIIDDPNADPNEGWTSVGMAKFTDPWVMPAIVDNPQEYTWEVELQRNDADADLYRLVDPYKGNCPVADLNESTARHGYIQFNISNPDMVTFDVVEAGFGLSNLGITKFYCMNQVTSFAEYFGISADYVASVMGDQIPYTTFKDGVLTLGSVETTDEDTGELETTYDACFGIQGNKDAGYSWTGAEMLGKIEFPNDLPSIDPNEDWTSLGNAEFQDPWVVPAFGVDPAEYTWEVELQQNKKDENVYRLVDPYKGNCPVAEINESSKAGYIIFNVSDPEHVSFDVVAAGFASSELGLSNIYCYNSLTWVSLYLNQSIASVIVEYGDMLPFTTFADGVVSLPETDACFGIPGEIDGGYSWTDANEQPVLAAGKITFPGHSGVNNVAVDSNNAPVEFYNLQGIRVSKPTPGQMLIKRQGKTAAKVYVR